MNKSRYHFLRYLCKEKCPKCGQEGYIEEGRIMNDVMFKTLHKQYEPLVKYARTIKVCYGGMGFSEEMLAWKI